MNVFNVELVSKNGGDPVATSVELSNKANASEYFGAWYKSDASFSDVVGWCKERITIYQRYIKNLNSLMASSRVKMVEGMSLDELKAIVAQKEADVVPAEA